MNRHEYRVGWVRSEPGNEGRPTRGTLVVRSAAALQEREIKRRAARSVLARAPVGSSVDLAVLTDNA